MLGVMRGLPSESVDFILTNPPYFVNYRDRSGRRTSISRTILATNLPQAQTDRRREWRISAGFKG
jgi:DNA modification methylase